jgi:LemA protein
VNPVPAIVLGVFAAIAFSFGLHLSRRLWAIVDTPTVPAGHAFPGRIEVAGVAGLAGKRRLISPLTGANCAWWKVEIQRHTGGNKGHWNTEGIIVSNLWVRLADDSGEVRIDFGKRSPRNCYSTVIQQRDLPHITPRMLLALANGNRPEPFVTQQRDEVGVLGTIARLLTDDPFGPELDLAAASGKWRAIEHRIEVGERIYALGHARSVGSGPLAMSRSYGPLVTYVGREKTLVRWLRFGAHFAMITFVLAAGASFAVLRDVRNELQEFDAPLFDAPLFDAPVFYGPLFDAPLFYAHMAIGSYFALIVLAVVQGVRIRNRILSAREQVYSSWALIEIADAKRAELIPPLVDIVKAAAAHERRILRALQNAQTDSFSGPSRAPSVERVTAASRAHRESLAVVDQLDLLLERYPSIATTGNFQQLFDELIELENNVAAAVGYYADAQNVLQDRVSTFPDSLFARFVWLPPELTEPET